MPLADDLSTMKSKPQRQPCAVAYLLKSLAPEDAAALEDALNNQRLYSTDLSKLLAKHGHRASQQTLQRHRRRACSCP